MERDQVPADATTGDDCGHWDKTSSGYRKLPFISRGRKTSGGGRTGSKAPIPTSQSDMINSVADKSDNRDPETSEAVVALAR